MVNDFFLFAKLDLLVLCNISFFFLAWFNIPYGADDDYITQMATMAYNNVRKDIKIYLEYSNEAWNMFFDSGKYTQKMGDALNLSTDAVKSRNYFYALRSKQIITIWKNVFGDRQDQLVLALGTLTVYPGVTYNILGYENVTKSHSNVMLSITGYFDCSITATVVANSEIYEILDACSADLPNVEKIIKNQAQIAKQFNISIGMYESGSSLMEGQAIYDGSETAGATVKYIAGKLIYKLKFFLIIH